MLTSNANASSIYELIGKTIKNCKIIDVAPSNSDNTNFYITCIKEENGEYKLYTSFIRSKRAPAEDKITIYDINKALKD